MVRYQERIFRRRVPDEGDAVKPLPKGDDDGNEDDIEAGVPADAGSVSIS